MICGKEFTSYHAAYMHIKRLHENHLSVQMNREAYTNQNPPTASLFSQNEAVRYEPAYYEPVHHERTHNEYRDFNKKEEKDNSGAILVFFFGLVAVGLWIYFRYFRGKFDFFGTIANREENEEQEPAFRVDNSMPVTKDGAYPVFQ
jgi:hypothetical protein